MMNCEFDCKAVKRHSKFITPPSLLFIFSDYGVSSRQAMIDEFDLDGDGEINEAEFFAIMTDDA